MTANFVLKNILSKINSTHRVLYSFEEISIFFFIEYIVEVDIELLFNI